VKMIERSDSDPAMQEKVAELYDELGYIKNSREFLWGSRLRQSRPFRWLRYVRLKDRCVRVKVTGTGNPASRATGVCLLGIWYDEYPDGFPFELLERTPKRWQLSPETGSPFGQCLLSRQADTIAVYTVDEDLRLDFRADGNSGILKVEKAGIQKEVDLFSTQPGTISIYPNRGTGDVTFRPSDEQPSEAWSGVAAPMTLPHLQSSRDKFTPTVADMDWLIAQQRDPRPLSLNHPEWRGVLASSRQLFDNIYTITDDLDRRRSTYYARLILESGVPSVTIQGFPKTYRYLIRALRQLSEHFPIFVIYHGSFYHMREDYDYQVLKLIKELHEHGEIDRVGFVKQGMAEIMAGSGMRTAFILNLVRHIPEASSTPLPGGPHVGIWAQPDRGWKKSPYAMFAALKLVPGARGHLYNVSPRLHEFGAWMGLTADYRYEAVRQDQVANVLSTMHLNLYVTLTECAPMLPLESLAAGTPCLFGPTSHYFFDHPYLHKRLVVPQPDNAQAIAGSANQALAEREDIIQAYQEYAPAYNQKALQALAEFLEFPVDIQKRMTG
jgi:hypothetical protein